MSGLSPAGSSLDMLERLVKENIPTGVRVFQHDLPTKKVFPSHAGPFQFHSAPQSKLNQDATPQARAYAVIPETGISLFILEAKEQHLLHECQPGLLAVPLLLLFFLNCIFIHLLCFGLAAPLHQPLSSFHNYDHTFSCRSESSNKSLVSLLSLSSSSSSSTASS